MKTVKTMSKEEIVENVVSFLNEDEKQLLKDTITEGVWVTAQNTFLMMMVKKMNT